MTWLTLTGVGLEIVAAATSATADPQLQFFENFPAHLGVAFGASGSDQTLSFHAVNIPLSVSFNQVMNLMTFSLVTNTNSTRTISNSFGLYSLTGGTLSLANSASKSLCIPQDGAAHTSWLTFATSATQNITPGTWYFAMMEKRNGNAGGWGYLMNSSINPVNAISGGFLMGRMTASTGALPASVATSDLDVTGSDAIRQPYIIITA